MHQNRFRRGDRPLYWALRNYGVPILVFVLVLFCFYTGLSHVDSASNAESLRSAEAALNRAVTSCYAIEGRYPPSLDYLRQNYGLRIDEVRYIVHYNCFASNIAPEMWVQERYF